MEKPSYYGEMDDRLLTFLSSFISGERYEKMNDVLSRRTDYLTVVLEDLHYSQNCSAIIRHCEAFGIQNLHVIENRNRFKVKNHAVRGTLKWINLNIYNEKQHNSLSVLNELKRRKYRIIATTPKEECATPENFDISTGPAALFFGNEREGLSPEVLDNADEFLHIPMEGFVDSLNISASCAIILQQLGSRLRTSASPWKLDDATRKEIMLEWLKSSIRKIDQVMKEFENTSI